MRLKLVKNQTEKTLCGALRVEMVVLVVENTTETDKVDVTHLFERGVSTKGERSKTWTL